MDWQALISVGLKIVAVLVLVLLNGFFVASEFALVKVRVTQLDPLVARGHRRAKQGEGGEYHGQVVGAEDGPKRRRSQACGKTGPGSRRKSRVSRGGIRKNPGCREIPCARCAGQNTRGGPQGAGPGDARVRRVHGRAARGESRSFMG